MLHPARRTRKGNNAVCKGSVEIIDWEPLFIVGVEALRVLSRDETGTLRTKLEIFEPLGVAQSRKDILRATAQDALLELVRASCQEAACE